MNSKKYWIWLSRLSNVNARDLNNLLKKYKTPENIWRLNFNELLENNIKNEQIEEILNKKNRENLDRDEDYLIKNNIDIINIYDKEYPMKLKNIYDPPSIIYIKGNKQILNKISLAIIGCRKCSSYGKETAKYFSKEIAKKNINIISGLARGIDSFSHIGALEAKGTTVAIVGTGLDITYPSENKYLEKNIIDQGGAIISEFAIGTSINKTNFPRRNRIISGIADGILVVEARIKSGTFITVDFALEQGKAIYAIPGNINSITSKGTNDLLKQGAKMVTEIQDILEDFY